MAFRAVASGAKSTWPWTRPLLTSAPWNSPPAVLVTARSCRSFSTITAGGEEIGTVTADCAYGPRRCHTAIISRQATPFIPIRKSVRLWKEDCPTAIARNETPRATRRYGRAFWKRWTGFHVRSRIEAKMRCLKSFDDHISARDPDRQTAEIQIRVALMNRFSAQGTAKIIRVIGY